MEEFRCLQYSVMSHLILIAFEQKAFPLLAQHLETLEKAFADSKT